MRASKSEVFFSPWSSTPPMLSTSALKISSRFSPFLLSLSRFLSLSLFLSFGLPRATARGAALFRHERERERENRKKERMEKTFEATEKNELSPLFRGTVVVGIMIHPPNASARASLGRLPHQRFPFVSSSLRSLSQSPSTIPTPLSRLHRRASSAPLPSCAPACTRR